MSQATTHIDEEAIRAKAYELWQLRGCPDGDPGDDWLRAERLLLEEAAERTQREIEPAPVTLETGAAAALHDNDATLPSGMPVPTLDAPAESSQARARGSNRRGSKRR